MYLLDIYILLDTFKVSTLKNYNGKQKSKGKFQKSKA